MPSQPHPGATEVAHRFALIVGTLSRMVAAHIAKDRAAGPTIVLIWQRLQRLVARFAAMAARAEAGTLRPLRPRPAPPETQNPQTPPEDRPKRPAPPKNPLPQNFGWLVRMMQVTASSGSQLQYFLSQPEVKAFLEAVPQAGKLLRPLCRALAFHPDPAVLPPPPPRPKRPPRPRKPRPPRTVWVRWRGIRMPALPPQPDLSPMPALLPKLA